MENQAPIESMDPLTQRWRPWFGHALMITATILCLVPFSNRAFHVDDPLFVWTAQQITRHPSDPYGFNLVWYSTEMPMSRVTQNPPLASYYGAVFGALAGWSERTLHLAFLLPSLAVVLGTYYLACRFTKLPLLAAMAVLLTPGFMVSACSVMSDIVMLALWILALILWLKGCETERLSLFASSGLLIGACALTKYFGLALLPLLVLYSFARRRRSETWFLFLMIPAVLMLGYQFWTRDLYGHGLLLDAARYAVWAKNPGEYASSLLVGMTFLGGGMLSALMFAPLCWSRRGLLIGAVLSGLAGVAIGAGWIYSSSPMPHDHWGTGIQLAAFIAGGGSVMALAILDLWKARNAESLLLAVWIFGTLYFACFLNWTINSRSIRPMIPAAAILLARRLEAVEPIALRFRLIRLLLPLSVSGIVSLCVAHVDARLANSARSAATILSAETRSEQGMLWFQGHWGFQYYMQLHNARAMAEDAVLTPGDFVALPENNTNKFKLNYRSLQTKERIEIPVDRMLTTMNRDLGAGFYTSVWGPLPYALGSVPAERYVLVRLDPSIPANK